MGNVLSCLFFFFLSIIQYSLEGLMLKLQYFDHLMRRTDSLEKTLMMGKIEGRRRMGWQRMRWLEERNSMTFYFYSSTFVRFGGAYSPWCHKDSDMSEQLTHKHTTRLLSKDGRSRIFFSLLPCSLVVFYCRKFHYCIRCSFEEHPGRRKLGWIRLIIYKVKILDWY